ncbi:MAG TPA: hypothetical protein VFN97_23315 [Actinospica sp.]|nr:hypothetical protein [Actinospica sp.]
MSETEKRDERVEANVRHIEEATEHLDQTVEEARAAARRADEADSMATPGVGYAVSEAEPAGDEEPEQREDEQQDRKD